MTLAACPARVDPRGLLNHSGVTCAAAAVPKATSHLEATWPSSFGKQTSPAFGTSIQEKGGDAVALRFNPFLQVPLRVSHIRTLQSNQEPL